jgi:hypothetical protein
VYGNLYESVVHFVEMSMKKLFFNLCCVHFRSELFLDFVCAQDFSA